MGLSSALCPVGINSPNISKKLKLFQRKETGKTAFLITERIIRMKTLELSELNFQCINVKVRNHSLYFFFLTLGKI